jgi:hypothetical protein
MGAPGARARSTPCPILAQSWPNPGPILAQSWPNPGPSPGPSPACNPACWCSTIDVHVMTLLYATHLAPTCRQPALPAASPPYLPPARPYLPPARPYLPLSRPSLPLSRPYLPLSRPYLPLSRPYLPPSRVARRSSRAPRISERVIGPRIHDMAQRDWKSCVPSWALAFRRTNQR